jgi:hypothetical protein
MSNLTFIINGQKVDIDKNIDFTRIYRGLETADVKKNNYSLTVKFPFTYVNDLVFKRTNSLTYKSNFPYDLHTCDVLTNGVILISKANLKLLSTTDSYECSLTWDNFDTIGAIINNPTKLGVFLESFNSLNWNYNHSLMSKSYVSGKADTYGYTLYNDGAGDVGIASTDYYSYQHPFINYKYLLDLIFTELGFTLSIPTVKNDFLQNLIIRPNKELDRYTNNVFEAFIDHYPYSPLSAIYFGRVTYINENTGTSPTTPSLGNNSYYFKSFINTTDGEDSFYINDGFTVPQIYRIRSFTDNTSVFEITDFTNTVGGQPTYLKKWKESDQTYHTLATINADTTLTVVAEEGDWFYFDAEPFFLASCNFKLKITTPVDVNFKDIPNDLKFPSLYHIPTNIDLTVGDIVKEALDFTCSQLTYNVNTDTYYFADRLNENSTAYDITEKITSIKEITYDTKYIYSKLAQENFFKYLTKLPIDADYSVLASDTRLVEEKTFIDSKFSTSNTQIGGTYDGTCQTFEHSFPSGQIWTQFTEQPLHLLWNDSANSKIFFSSDLFMGNIFDLFWQNYINDLLSLVLSGTVRLLKVNTEIQDIEFKRVNLKGSVYIKNYGKYYGIIEVAKNGDFAEFFLLELF